MMLNYCSWTFDFCIYYLVRSHRLANVSHSHST